MKADLLKEIEGINQLILDINNYKEI